MATPIYYDFDGDSICRRRDGNPRILPDEILWSSGWRRLPGALVVSPDVYPERTPVDGSPHPAMWTMLTRITPAEARSFARRRGLSTTGWDVTTEAGTR